VKSPTFVANWKRAWLTARAERLIARADRLNRKADRLLARADKLAPWLMSGGEE
jgi:hypothetical protein